MKNHDNVQQVPITSDSYNSMIHQEQQQQQEQQQPLQQSQQQNDHDDENVTKTQLLVPSRETITPDTTNQLTTKALNGTIITILLRFISFGCTQVTYRTLPDPRVIGTTNIQFELILSTILFMSREGFRLALLSSSSSSSSKTTTTTTNSNTPSSSKNIHKNSLTTTTTTTTPQTNHSQQEKNDSATTTTTTATTQSPPGHTIIDDATMWNFVAWFTIPVTTLVSLTAMMLHVWQQQQPTIGEDGSTNSSSSSSDYWYGGILYCLAAMVEGWGEPAVLMLLKEMNVSMKASAEGLAVLCKTGSLPLFLYCFTFTTTSTTTIHYPMIAFGCAQLLYSIVYTVFLYYHVSDRIQIPNMRWFFSLWSKYGPQQQNTLRSFFQQFIQHLVPVLLFTCQSMIKHCLTEGDKIVLTMLSGSYDQGIYAMGSAYGGLAARLLFQPLEENSRILYSRLLVAIRTNTNNNDNINNNDRSSEDHQKQQEQMDETIHLLRTTYLVLVKCVLYVGFLFSCVAVHYTSIVLILLAGKKWGTNEQAAIVLSAFCIYTGFLALNGMTEAFLYAIIASSASTTTSSTTIIPPTKENKSSTNTETAINENDTSNPDSTNPATSTPTATTSSTKQQQQTKIMYDISQLSFVHTLVGFIFAIVAFFAVPYYGTIGLVMANCIAMFLRALYAVIFAAQYFVHNKTNEMTSMSPLLNQTKTNSTTTKLFLEFGSLLRGMFPKPIIVVAFIISYVITSQSSQRMYQLVHFDNNNTHSHTTVHIGSYGWYQIVMQHIGIGIACVVGTLTLAYIIEKEFRQSIYELWKGRKNPIPPSIPSGGFKSKTE